jgi:hypothetical protein
MYLYLDDGNDYWPVSSSSSKKRPLELVDESHHPKKKIKYDKGICVFSPYLNLIEDIIDPDVSITPDKSVITIDVTCDASSKSEDLLETAIVNQPVDKDYSENESESENGQNIDDIVPQEEDDENVLFSPSFVLIILEYGY